MGGRRLLLGSLLIVLICILTEGRKVKKRERFRGNMVNRKTIMLSDDPLLGVTSILPRTKIGTCSCKCCEEKPARLVEPPCLNDVIVAVDSSACFRDHHSRMTQFLGKLVNEFHKSGPKTQFGAEKTRLGILQFSSENAVPLTLADFENYSVPPTSKALKGLIQEKIGELGFLGEGAFLNKALNATVLEFLAHPRPEQVLRETEADHGKIRKVVIVLTNGKSHPSVTREDIDHSISYLKSSGVTVLPVSVTRRCFGSPSADWDEGLCPDLETMKSLSQLSTYEDEDFLPMRASGTISTVVKEAIDCKYETPAPLTDLCNNCTCDCELPIGPPGEPGIPGPKGDSIQGPNGDVGPKGDDGDIGPIGFRGDPGEKGIKGEVGPIGDKGAIGPQGPQGDQGIEGLEGLKGEEGDIGITGEKGEVGQKGDTGEYGNTGDKGDIGEQGPKGSVGDDGERGVEGPKGQPGEDGESVKGDDGDLGLKGSKGMIGRDGPRGPKGMTGLQGLCGKPGPAGPQGEPGLSGVDGQDGVTGPPGIQGPRGAEGIQGETGLRGEPGIDGQRGTIGPDGPPGPFGLQGEPGQRGADGRDSEVPGPEGPLGPTGRRGESGENGLDGMQGPQGEQGSRGFQGPKGEEGSIDLEGLRPLLVDIIRGLLPGECVVAPGEILENGCTEYPIDLVFLIDGSDSISREDFHEVQQWILRTVDRFKPMDREVKLQLDVVQFSEDVENPVHALIRDSSEEVREDVEGIDQMRSGTKTYTGLRFVNSDVSPSTRTGSNKILVTMTDGDASQDRDQAAIDEARSFYNIMVGVGIGSKVDIEQLKDFSNSDIPPITVEQFSALEGVIDQIVQESCKKIREDGGRTTEAPVIDDGEPTPPPDKEYSRCVRSRADIAFLIDGSSSVGDENFGILRQFLYNMVSSFEYIQPDGFRVLIIQYNDNPRIELSFDDSTDQAAVLNRIENLEYLTGNTQTGMALERAYDIFREIKDSGERTEVPQVVVVITDGRSQDDVAEPALALKEDGVTIFAIGVTDSSEHRELADMATSPEDDHIYKIASYEEIASIKESLLRKMCTTVRGSYRVFDEDGDILEDYGEEDLLTGAVDYSEYGPTLGSGAEELSLDLSP